MKRIFFALLSILPALSGMELISHFAQSQFQQGNLHLFDGVDGNQQCHINALIIALTKKQGELQDADKEFICANFLLSPFTRAQLTRIAHEIDPQNPQGIRSIFFDECITDGAKKIIKTFHHDFLISHPTESVRLTRDLLSSFYCLPKFIGVNALIDLAKANNIPFVVHCKLLCEHGMHIDTRTIMPHRIQCFNEQLGLTNPDQPVIVTEMISSVDPKTPSFKKIMQLRKKCPHSVFSHAKIDPNHSCKLCSPAHQQCQHFINHTQIFDWLPFSSVQLMIAASFTSSCQKESLPIMQKVMPEMHSLLEALSHDARQCGMSESSLHVGMIEHMYPSTLGFAVSNPRLIDRNENIANSE